jgi:signal transduction histidine kinase
MNSLGSRLTLWYAALVTVTLASVLILGNVLLRVELTRSIDLLNAAQFQEIRNRVQSDQLAKPEADFLEQISEHARIDAPLYFFQVRDAQGTVFLRSANLGRTVFPPNPNGKHDWTFAPSGGEKYRISTFAAGSYQVQVATSLQATRELERYYDHVSAVALLAVAIMSSFMGYRLSRLALDPIRQIQQAAQRINANNLKERIAVAQVRDEISDLAVLLNQMFDRLEKAFGRLSRFAGEASHELKTPLSIIRLQSEKLLTQSALSGEQQEAVQQQLKSIHGLHVVIEKLLFIARAEAGAIQVRQTAQNTREFVDSFAEDAGVLCEDHGVGFEIVRNGEKLVPFDASLMRQVLLNLLSNALKATLLGGRISVTSTTDDSDWKIVVDDTGLGLPTTLSEEDIFKPFVGGDGERDGPIGNGTGLGLAICRGILELHHGAIRAESHGPQRGLRVIVTIPLKLA